MKGTTDNLTCRDRSGQEAEFGFFDSEGRASSAYQAAVAAADVPTGSGNCERTAPAEHRYPAVGTPRGRLLCVTEGGRMTLIWSDPAARLVARTESPDAAAAALAASWARWIDEPDFASQPEQRVLDLMPQNDCQRVPANLDTYPAAEVALECVPNESGPRVASFYRFSDLDALKRTYNDRVAGVDAPSGRFCGDQPPNFLGNFPYATYEVTTGDLLCYRDGGEFVVEWTIEPLLIHARAVGPDPRKLMTWWANIELDRDQFADGFNKVTGPPYPTSAEKDLLNHIPAATRVNCFRLAKAELTLTGKPAPMVGVMCGPTPGADHVFYYQFRDRAAMQENYGGPPEPGLPDCTGLPAGFSGESPYRRDGKVAGWLLCGTREDGYRQLFWTDDRLKIEAMATGLAEPSVMIDWWRTEAGPR